jgi:hypothetical protein
LSRRQYSGRESDLQIVAEIKRKFGAIIDLDKSPFVILEVIRNFRNFDNDNGVGGGEGMGGGVDSIGIDDGVDDGTVSTIAVGIDDGVGGGVGGGGVGPGTVSTIAVGITPPSELISNADLMREILKMGRTLKQILDRLNTMKL